MPKSFRIRNLVDLGRWVPEDPELRDLTYFVDDGVTPRGTIRQMLFNNIESLRPGEYELDLTIEDARQEVFQRIDTRTGQLIEKGFEYNGIVFSNSANALPRYNFMYTTALAQIQTGDHTLGFSYPLTFNSLDDTATITLTNPIETLQFCGAAANTVQAHVDSGTVLKAAVRSATTQEELDAFLDNRGVESLPPPSEGAVTPDPEEEEPPPSGEGDTPPEEPPPAPEEPPPADPEPPTDGTPEPGDDTQTP